MKSILTILKTTLWGGIFVLFPVALLVIIIGKVFALLQKLLQPILNRFTGTLVADMPLVQRLIAILILLLICLGAGLLARTRATKRFIHWLEDSILNYVPGYTFLKNMGKNISGLEKQDMKIVLARVDDGWQLSFLIEQIGEDLYTVFVPDAPDPWSGSVYHMEKDKIIWTNITNKQAISCLRQLGFGSASILKDTFDINGKIRS